jgi:hypothetical protein
MASPGSPAPTVAGKHIDELVELTLLFGGLSTRDGVRHARLDVGTQDGFRSLGERRFCRGELEEHVHAVSVFLDHARDPFHLALNPTKACEDLTFDCSVQHG